MLVQQVGQVAHEALQLKEYRTATMRAAFAVWAFFAAVALAATVGDALYPSGYAAHEIMRVLEGK